MTTNCIFSLDRLHISRTRSRKADTNFLTLSVKVGSNSPTTIYGKLGDMEDGDYDLAQRFQQAPAPPTNLRGAASSLTRSTPCSATPPGKLTFRETLGFRHQQEGVLPA